MEYTADELKAICLQHIDWINGNPEGVRANLSGAYLSGANLSEADLSRANLSRANLYGANLSGAKNAELAIAMTVITPQGDLIGWKKCRAVKGFCIVKLHIPSDAKRSSASGRKCRAEYAKVIEVIGAEKGFSHYDDGKTEYIVGAEIRPDKFDENRWDEWSNGIHFFITREEAEAYDL